VCYWGLEESYEEDGTDYNVKFSQLAVVYINEDVEFVA
jgi:hypothetical protein